MVERFCCVLLLAQLAPISVLEFAKLVHDVGGELNSYALGPFD